MIVPTYHRIELLRARFVAEPMPMMRQSAIDALLELQDEGLAPFLLSVLDDASTATKAECLEGLCRVADPLLVAHVRPYLADPHPNLRRLALIVLWQFPDERRGLMPTVYDLFPTMKEDDYRHLPVPVRASYTFGIRAVGDIRWEGAVPALRDGLAWDDPHVRLECACSLLNLDCRDGMREIRDRVDNGDEEARRRLERLPIDRKAFFG